MSTRRGPKNLCGDRIRKLRNAARKTLVDISVELELDYGLKLERSVLGRIEHSARQITDFELSAIAAALNTTPADLLSGEGAIPLAQFAKQAKAVKRGRHKRTRRRAQQSSIKKERN